MNNVHEDAPEIFQTRWALSYLRGPLSRQEIKRLMSSRAPAPAVPASAAPVSPHAHPAAEAGRGTATTARAHRATADRPVLPPEVLQYFAPARGGDAPRYVPMLLGSAQIRYADTKTRVDLMEDVLLLTPIAEGPATIDWTASTESAVALNAFGERPAEGATFAPLPSAGARAKSYEAWSKAFAAWLAGNRRLSLYYCAPLKMTSLPGEDERAFRIRLQQVSRERRDAAVEQLRRKFAPKLAGLQDRIRRAAQATGREAEQVSQHTWQTMISAGATALDMLFGRKGLKASTVGRATTTARGMSRTMREREDVARAKENESALQQQLDTAERELATEVENIELALNPASLPLEALTLAPKKSHVTVRLVALAWVPDTTG
jgi:hypothetical protein